MTNIIRLFTLLIVLSVFSCKDDEAEPSLETTGPLYLRFEIDGVKKEYRSSQAYWGGGTSTNGMDTYGNLMGYTDGELGFDFSQNTISLSDLIGLEGKTIPFGEGDPINAFFTMYDEDGIEADSYRIYDHPSTSSVTITDVYEQTGLFFPIGKLARITGTFQTQIEDVYSPEERHDITNGEFSLIMPSEN